MNHLFDTLCSVGKDVAFDTLRLIPFLFATYVFMEFLEYRAADVSRRFIRRAGAAGPIVGAAVGVVPQCGFSAMAATLFSGRVITLGTLVAVILSTSDEMVPVFLANNMPFSRLASILFVKFFIGVICGFALDMGMRFLGHRQSEDHCIHELCEREGCNCALDVSQGVEVDDHVHESCHLPNKAMQHKDTSRCYRFVPTRLYSVLRIVRAAAIHTLRVGIFIVIAGLILNLAIALVGEKTFAACMAGDSLLTTIVCAFVGLIPSCAASTIISELYFNGVLTAGAMMAGLLVAGGVGLLVLFRSNKNLRMNVCLVILLWVIGVVCGLLINVIGLSF